METISLLILIDKMRILNGWIIIILLLLVIIANIEQQGTVVLTFLFCFVFFDQNRQTVSLTSFLNNFHYIWFRLSNLDSVPKKRVSIIRRKTTFSHMKIESLRMTIKIGHTHIFVILY